MMPAAVAWRRWRRATFEEARQAGKPLYINVTASWCHWCHVMDEQTFGDPRVADLLSRSYVAIRVDADARPDLAERYADWGWPASAILTPDGHPVAERRGFQEPDDFMALLEQVSRAAQDGTLRPKAREPEPPAEARPRGAVSALRDLCQAQLDAHYDVEQGGWGRRQKYPMAAPLEHAFLRSARGEAAWRARIERTLAGTMRLIDPVHGGAFQYSVGGGWDDPHFEKIAAVNAGVLDNLAHAYAATGRRRYLRGARRMRDYLASHMTNPDGSFGSSQDADVDTGTGRMTGSAYYRLGAAKRRAAGTPRIDRTAYADWNGLLIAGLCRLADASADARALGMAERAARAILRTHRRGPGFAHTAEGSSPIHLRDNASMGRALLMLARSAQDEGHAGAALEVARAILGLESPDGGFQAHSRDPEALGSLAEPRMPLEENGLAIRFLTELHWQFPDVPLAQAGRAAAQRAAERLAEPGRMAPEGRIIGNFLMGLEVLGLQPMVLEVKGSGDRLWRAALRVQRADIVPSRSDGPGPAVVHACQGTACSVPMRTPKALRDFLAANPPRQKEGPGTPADADWNTALYKPRVGRGTAGDPFRVARTAQGDSHRREDHH